MLAKIRYRIWLLFGNGLDDLFKFLSDSILRNRELISKQHGLILGLESRLWKLEDHSTEETLEKVTIEVEEWSKDLERFKKC